MKSGKIVDRRTALVAPKLDAPHDGAGRSTCGNLCRQPPICNRCLTLKGNDVNDHHPKHASAHRRSAQLHRAMPRSWPATVKHLCNVLLTLSDPDNGNIDVSREILVEHTGEMVRTVQRGLQFLRSGGFLVSTGTRTHANGTVTPRNRLELPAILAARELEDNTEVVFAEGDAPL